MTASLAVLADDLTGALTSAANIGGDVQVVWRPEQIAAPMRSVVVNMSDRDTQAGHRELAASWARRLAAAGHRDFECRMDSTLTGHTAAELAGILDALGDSELPVFAIPAYPEAGRLTMGGVQEIRNDAQASRFADVGEAIFGRPADIVVSVTELTADICQVAERLASAVRRVRGLRCIFDAEDSCHLARIGAVLGLLRQGVRYVTVSPGGWLAYRSSPERKDFTLVVVASPTLVNLAQLAALRTVVATTEAAAHPGEMDQLWAALESRAYRIVVVSTVDQRVDDGARVPGRAHAAVEHASRILAAAAAAGWRCRRIVVTGGYAAEALLRMIAPATLRLIDSVGPMCSRAAIRVPDHGLVEFITKGGQMGTADTLRRLSLIPPYLSRSRDEEVSPAHA
jgi:D-threonate/D-erythronate kinase